MTWRERMERTQETVDYAHEVLQELWREGKTTRGFAVDLVRDDLNALAAQMEEFERERNALREGAVVWNATRELPCCSCGRDNPVWWVANDIWNRVVGTPENPRGEGVILCVTCFVKAVAERLEQADEALRDWVENGNAGLLSAYYVQHIAGDSDA